VSWVGPEVAGVLELGLESRDEALARAYDSEFRPLCRVAYLILGDAFRAEEAVQDAFVRTFAGWRRLRDPAKLRAYLRRCVVNECHTRLRRQRVELKSNEAVSVIKRDASAAPADSSLAALELARVISLLPARQREAIVLRYYLDMAEPEVAEAMGCSLGNVKSQLSRAREKLGKLLEGPRDEAATSALAHGSDPDEARPRG
jgi:RNA polymerase sigma-70 factor (sigma-E family)